MNSLQIMIPLTVVVKHEGNLVGVRQWLQSAGMRVTGQLGWAIVVDATPRQILALFHTRLKYTNPAHTQFAPMEKVSKFDNHDVIAVLGLDTRPIARSRRRSSSRF